MTERLVTDSCLSCLCEDDLATIAACLKPSAGEFRCHIRPECYDGSPAIPSKTISTSQTRPSVVYCPVRTRAIS